MDLKRHRPHIPTADLVNRPGDFESDAGSKPAVRVPTPKPTARQSHKNPVRRRGHAQHFPNAVLSRVFNLASPIPSQPLVCDGGVSAEPPAVAITRMIGLAF